MGSHSVRYLRMLALEWGLVWLAVIGGAAAEEFSFFRGGPPNGGNLLGGSTAQDKPVRVSAVLTGSLQSRQAELRITVTLEPDWYIYSLTQQPGPATPSRITLEPSDAYHLEGPFQPDTPAVRKQDPTFDNAWIEMHLGTITWRAPVRWADGVDPKEVVVRGRLRAQACTSTRCLAPQEFPFTAMWMPGQASADVSPPGLPGPAVPPETYPQGASGSEASSGEKPGAEASGRHATGVIGFRELAVKVGFAFLGGLILNLMPCVLPVISLKLFSFLQQTGESRSRIMILNLWYTAGLMSVFFVLAALTAALGHAWGEQFTLPWFKIVLTALVFVMALSFLGVWEIPIPGFTGGSTSVQLQQKEGPTGAFFKGVFATILATPCSGPFLGALFGFLLGQPAAVVFLIFGAVGLGMAMPYLVLGAFPELIRFFPKPGPWMETLKELMGFFLLGTVVFLFSTLQSKHFVPTLALLLGLWLACWWIGRIPWTAKWESKIAAWIGGAAVAALIGWTAFSILAPQSKIPWQPFSPEAVAKARSEGKTVLVNFTADWCLTCKANLKLVIDTPDVRQRIAENGVVPLLADWTDESPVIKEALNQLGYNSIPVVVIWPADPSREPMILPDLLTKGQLLEALQRAGPSRTRPVSP